MLQSPIGKCMQVNLTKDCILQVKAVLGATLSSKSSNGAKKMEVTAVGDDLDTIFPGGLSKSLRYGATLELVKVCCINHSVQAWHTITTVCHSCNFSDCM